MKKSPCDSDELLLECLLLLHSSEADGRSADKQEDPDYNQIYW